MIEYNGFISLTLSGVGIAYLLSSLTKPIIKLTSCDVTSIAATDGCFVKGALNVSKTDSNIKEIYFHIKSYRNIQMFIIISTFICLKAQKKQKKNQTYTNLLSHSLVFLKRKKFRNSTNKIMVKRCGVIPYGFRALDKLSDTYLVRLIES